MTMTLKTYLDILGTKITEAGEKGDRVEAIRLLKLGQDLFSDEIRKLEQQLQLQQQHHTEGKAHDGTSTGQ